MDEDILEKLSELEHVQWCEWAGSISKYLDSLLAIIDKSDAELSDEDKLIVLNAHEKLEKWDKLMIPYSDLSEDEKEKDRAYARKALDIINP
ncbi:hypothetical protein [Methanobrevibacter sp.]|uniref:hypothetical protein n=1 Tax=Methanobrevibacter sp. TaxID=66852 RepID=UPI00388FA8DD